MYKQKLKQALNLFGSEPDSDSGTPLITMLTTTAENLLGPAENFSAENLAKTEWAIKAQLDTPCNTMSIAVINLMLTILQAIEQDQIPNYQSPHSPIFSAIYSYDNPIDYQITRWSDSVSQEEVLSIKNWYIFLRLASLYRSKPFLICALLPQTHFNFFQMIRDYLNASLIQPKSVLITALLFNANLKEGRQHICGLSGDALCIVTKHLETLVADLFIHDEIRTQALTNFNSLHLLDIALILQLPRDQQVASLLKLCQYFINHYGYDETDKLLDSASVQDILLTYFAKHNMQILKEHPQLFALILHKFADHDVVMQLLYDRDACQEILTTIQYEDSLIYRTIRALISQEIIAQHLDSYNQDHLDNPRKAFNYIKYTGLNILLIMGLISAAAFITEKNPKALPYAYPLSLAATIFLAALNYRRWRSFCRHWQSTEQGVSTFTTFTNEADVENPPNLREAFSAEAQVDYEYGSTADMLAVLQEKPLFLLVPELMPVCQDRFPTLAQLTACSITIEPTDHSRDTSTESTPQIKVPEQCQTVTEQTPLLQYPGF